ncbi:MAG TPA: DUF397 domain-containing protein [Pseudonocardiaceae bacterium]|nr:DUF397 domain-containing protein [Pseudonocardiaceae bacterium]
MTDLGVAMGTWQRAAACGPDGGNCVEIDLNHDGRVGVRDSADPAALTFGPREWLKFVVAARAGRYDRH